MLNSNESNIPINTFDLNSVVEKHIIYVIHGAKDSGKTKLTSKIANFLEMYHRKYDQNMIISGYSDQSPFLQNYDVCQEYSSDHFDKFSMTVRQNVDNKTTRFLHIADQVPGIEKNDKYVGLYMNHRHYRISMIYTSQYPLSLTPALRGNSDYIFILAEKSPSVREMLYHAYGCMIFSNVELFYKVLDQCTQNNGGTMVIRIPRRSRKDTQSDYDMIKEYVSSF